MDYTEKDFGKILKGNALKMRRLMLQSGTTCMRVYDRNLERFPVTVDLYGSYARVTDYSEDGLDEEVEQICCDIVSRMLYIQKDHVVFHRRPKRVGKEQHGLQSEDSLMVQVQENELFFTVDLTKRIDTGLFLDHMPTRAVVQQMSMNGRVLNLFSYTGSFSVYAARGGAVSVESVDLSSTYTQWAQKNLADNGYAADAFPCITSDAWNFVIEAYVKGKKYDLIIFDPPSFSNSRKMDHDFDVQRDYLRWLRALNALLARDGRLVFSTNLGTFSMDERAIRGFEIEEITKQVAAPGFTRRLGTARTWLLTKQEELRIPESWIKSVRETAEKEQHEESGQDAPEKNKEEIIMSKEKKIESEEMEQEVKTEVEAATVVTSEADDQQDDELVVLEGDEDSPEVAEANEVEDDLLTLQWDEADFAPVANEEAKEENRQERSESSFSDRRDDRRPRSFSRDRDDRRGGDRDRRRSFDRDDRRPRFSDRDDRRSNRGDDRPRFNDRDDRRSSFGRDDRPRFNDRDDRRSFSRDDRPRFNDRDDRRSSFSRDDRPRFNDRDDRRSSFSRDDRPRFNDRDDRRPSFSRDDRPRFNDRDDRRSSFSRDDRPRFNDRDDRRSSFSRDDRPRFNDRDDRRSSFSRDDRPRFNDRDDRRSSFSRDDRPRFNDRNDRRPSFSRDDRPRFNDRDDRRSSFSRDDRPGFSRKPGGRPSFSDDRRSREGSGERRPRKSGPKPYGFDGFRPTRTRGENEDDPFFSDRGNKDSE